jgi:5-methylcytosine-specific restriction protein A
MHNFQIGQLYSRKQDIHDRFGGSQRSGISHCKDAPFIFLFTGSLGEQYGYKDHWDSEGLFRFTGEGQTGDMRFSNGNKAIRDHQLEGRDLLLFEQLGKSKPYRFLGEFVCTSYEYKGMPDREGHTRQGIVFHLLNVDEEIEGSQEVTVQITNGLQALRQLAYASAKSAPQVKSTTGKTNYYERNANIKRYVLARANGVCECCGKPAPFLKRTGQPYLEPHHILKLSDKGLDHPRMVAAVTPNCHREIHHGAKGETIDRKLLELIAQKESAQIELS